MTKQTKFITAIVLQLLIILTIIIFKIAVLTGGTEVLLKIEPVDPRDPLRGDYITFQYQISNINFRSQLKPGDTIYVPLQQKGKYWVTMYSVQKIKPVDSGRIFIKGKVSRSFGSSIRVAYGIEDYFIPEGAGKEFRFQEYDVSAAVFIDENGNAALKQIYVDDKPWP